MLARTPIANVTETVLDLGSVQVSRSRQLTAAEQDRYDAYLADKARCEAEEAKADREFAESVTVWLGDRASAVMDVLPGRSSQFELDVTIVGKTAEAAQAEADAYCERHEGKLPRFGAVQPWHQLFRITGTRRASI